MPIHKFLWSVRLFKTRSKATSACNKEQVRLNGDVVKASKLVQEKNVIALKNGAFWREFKVLDFPKSRVGAKLVGDFMLEITPKEVLDQLTSVEKLNRENQALGIKGRPTKKDRRDLDKRRFDY
jgi:ribosome-associated heat shock protein Hsp15